MSPVKRLFSKPAPAANLLIRSAHVLDPRTGLDGLHDVLIRNGEIAEIGGAGGTDSLSAPISRGAVSILGPPWANLKAASGTPTGPSSPGTASNL